MYEIGKLEFKYSNSIEFGCIINIYSIITNNNNNNNVQH